jgi:DNA-directed RNA polymerase specialized sigma24 family protein
MVTILSEMSRRLEKTSTPLRSCMIKVLSFDRRRRRHDRPCARSVRPEDVLMFQTTVSENFKSWDRFLDAYYAPIRAAIGLLPFVGEGRADDVAQSFFIKMYEHDLLANPPRITGRFRHWLYSAARNHALDEWRKIQRRREHPDPFDVREPVDSRAPGQDDGPFDADELYALSVLHLAVSRVRKHLLEEGKAEHWSIFEELVLAPLFPGRIAKTRDELLAKFPGQKPVLLDNRITTVKRVFRRILPALVPADPTENRAPRARFQELIDILGSSQRNRLWLAFLKDPLPGIDAPDSSGDLAARSTGKEASDATVCPEILEDELRILLGLWLQMPLGEYLPDLESVGRAVAAAIRDSRPSGSSRGVPTLLNLRGLIEASHPRIVAIPGDELRVVCERLKTFAKRAHGATRRDRKDKRASAASAARLESSLPFEVAQVLYNLAGALALCRCDARIIGLGDDQYRKNITWVLNQPWLDARLRPLFQTALSRLRTGSNPR